MENIIKQKLIERGFSQKTLLNNRGLIGACIEETKEQLTIPVVIKQSELLKDKENLSFKGWMRLKGYKKNDNEPWLKDDKICTGSELIYMLEKY